MTAVNLGCKVSASSSCKLGSFHIPYNLTLGRGVFLFLFFEDKTYFIENPLETQQSRFQKFKDAEGDSNPAKFSASE